MKAEKAILFSLVLGLVLTLGSTVRFETETIPDSTVTRHGLPLFWLHHQTSSIAGPVNLWSVQWLGFAVNYGFWVILSAVLVFVLKRDRS